MFLSKDAHGCDMVIVTKEQLEDFPSLIQTLRDKGYGARTGVLKLRLESDDRDDARVLAELAAILQRQFKEKIKDPITKKKKFAFNPQVQLFFKASVNDDIYQYSADYCTAAERKKFIEEASDTQHLDIAECCKLALERSVEEIRKHCFEGIRKSARFTPELESKEERSQKVLGTQDLTLNQKNDSSHIIYGAGVVVDKPIKITGNFSLSSLKTILDLLDEEHDGIATPYAYIGSSHTTFPWHIEDGGLFSLNYVIAGAPKLWFVFPPQAFGLVDAISQTFCMRLGHTSCRALLADHKVLYADPEYFKENFGIPYSTVIQEPGELLVLFPFALHSGMNLGRNYALASNFADEEWIPDGMYAPVCACNPLQVHLDISPIIKECKPELLQTYLKASGSLFPKSHPREVRRFATASSDIVTALSSSSNQSTTNTSPSLLVKRKTKPAQEQFKYRRLRCTNCKQSYNENKMDRLEEHVKKQHPDDADNIIRMIKKKYPPWQPKTSFGFTCKICGTFRRGSITQLRNHHSRFHAKAPFEGGIKSVK